MNASTVLDAGVRTVAVGSALEDPAQLPALAALLASLTYSTGGAGRAAARRRRTAASWCASRRSASMTGS